MAKTMKSSLVIGCIALVLLVASVSAEDRTPVWPPEKGPTFREITSSAETLRFFLLGMIDEYGGKTNTPDSGRWWEKDEIPRLLFQRYTTRLVALAKLSSEKEAMARVLALYEKKSLNLAHQEVVFVSRDIFRHYPVEMGYAFIAGAYARYWCCDHFDFANATHKANALGDELVNLGCSNVELRSRLDITPIDNRLYVTPTVPLKKVFDEVQSELTEIKKNLPNKASLQTPSSITPPAGVPVP